MKKICTDIEQSKKLIELGIDVNTADMMWEDWGLVDEGWVLGIGYYPEIEKDYGRKCYPAWSLTALLDIIPSDQVNFIRLPLNGENRYAIQVLYGEEWKFGDWKSNPINACVEMIIKLKERNLL